MSAKARKVDASRFEGNGISFKAKLIGVEDVAEARGDQMCQVAITKLKNSVKISGQHKQKILVNVTLDGLKIIDAISMAANQNKKKNENRQSKSNVDGEEAEKSQETIVLHSHAVHQISFISRDVTDNRAFGYVFGSGDGSHKFFAIKTATASEQLVLTLRDLFQVVYDMKKKEVDEAKLKLGENNATEAGEEENSTSPGSGSTSGTGQAPTQNADDAENIYRVPPNNAPANPTTQEEQVANLLDLEDQADHILKGIEQIKNLEFDSTTPTNDLSPTSPVSPAGNVDPWGATSTSTTALSSDLASLSFNTSPFGGQQQAFPGIAFPQNQSMPAMSMPSAGLPVTKDPFGTDPFAAQQSGVRPAGFPTTTSTMPGFGAPANQPVFGAPASQPGFGAPANPFGAPRMTQPFAGAQPGVAMPQMMMGPPGMMSGMTPRGMVHPAAAPAGPGASNPFSPFGETDVNVLTPLRKETEQESAPVEEKKNLHEDLFGDLVGMKKSASGALTPKDMFAQIKAPEKKSMNAMKSGQVAAPQASFLDADPFGESDCIFSDKTRGLVNSEEGDPFDTSHIPALPAIPPAKFSPHHPIDATSSTSSSSPIPPPVPQRHALQNSNIKECSRSSSSTSLSSSNSIVSTALPSNPAPSITPPPRPVRAKENTAVSSPSTPSHLPLADESTPVNISTPNAFMLPSPDEPPPPLPENFMSTPVAPPPPPRPSAKSNFSSFPEDNPAKSVHNSPQKQNLTDASSHKSSSLSAEKNKTDNKANTHSLDASNLPTVQSDWSQSNQDVFDPFNISLKSSANNSFKCNNNNDNSKSNNDNIDSSTISTQNSLSTDPFAPFTEGNFVNQTKVDTETQNSSLKREAGETDPFGLPVHLTPGFKAVAKFGSDPFEDSFHAGLSESQSQDKWEPFAESTAGHQKKNDPWDATNAFGDPFNSAPPAQPVNGNTSGNSLMD